MDSGPAAVAERSTKLENVHNLLSRFDPKWGKAVKDATPEEVRDAVISVVSNRHQIAHGRSVGITKGHTPRKECAPYRHFTSRTSLQERPPTESNSLLLPEGQD